MDLLNARPRGIIALIAGLLLLALSLGACDRLASRPPTAVVLQLRWTHQAQSAGFYAADQYGYYAAEGLAVTFVEGGPKVDLVGSVLARTAQFGVVNADQLLVQRSAGKSLRAIATVYRRSPAVYIALASSGITRPEDFAGKTIQVGAGGSANLHAVTARVGLRPEQYTEVNLGTDLGALYTNKVQVWSGFVTNEALTIQASGRPVNLISPDDYGVHFYADTLFTSDDLIARDPDLVRRFLRASLRGWTTAIESPTTAGALVAKYRPDADAGHEIDFLTTSIPLINTGEDRIGWMRPEIWAGMARVLREQAILTAQLSVTDAYTLRFLQDIYGGGTG